jgi:hypothetical protein
VKIANPFVLLFRAAFYPFFVIGIWAVKRPFVFAWIYRQLRPLNPASADEMLNQWMGLTGRVMTPDLAIRFETFQVPKHRPVERTASEDGTPPPEAKA